MGAPNLESPRSQSCADARFLAERGECGERNQQRLYGPDVTPKLYVTNSAGDNIHVIDLGALKVISQIHTGEGPHGEVHPPMDGASSSRLRGPKRFWSSTPRPTKS
jgi:YVTN family beta-propeller protein